MLVNTVPVYHSKTSFSYRSVHAVIRVKSSPISPKTQDAAQVLGFLLPSQDASIAVRLREDER
jgi:hypothetical protein